MIVCTQIKLNPKLFLLISVLIFTLINTSSSRKIIMPYLLQDEYFDKIFEIHDTDSSKLFYLHMYCKEKNLFSLSINDNIEFEEHPRFPIHPAWKQTPKMQKKIYTFFQSCNIEIKANTDASGNNENFIVDVIRKDTKVSLFKIKDFTYVASNHIIIDTEDNSLKWGLGERFQRKFHVNDGTWTIWNRDRPWEIDEGSPQRSGQTYGHQPVYLAKERSPSGKFHLVYFKTTYGFNFQSKDSSTSIKYFVTGGPIHFLILQGDMPETVLQQYHRFIGNAHVPPFWSLGYHQCRWGYKSIDEVSEVVKNFDSFGLPIDIIWSDLDYMHEKAIFTVDTYNFAPDKVRKLLIEKNLHFVPLIDVGVSIADSIAMNKGKEMNVYLKYENKNPENLYKAKVWPGMVHFVDYLHPNASDFWQSQLDRLYSQIPFSGVWLDMNQPSNFNGNQMVKESYKIQHTESINMMTIDVNLDHFLLSSKRERYLKHQEVHAYYGHLSTIPTHHFLKKHGRPFIISRSNSIGSGAYAGHWTGDNVATWDFLRLSISGNFLFQIFGVQMVGADICGFRGNTNEQLCSRWMQVGSMYPFSRNHNENESISQQPYRFGQGLIDTTKLSYLQRYSLLKQMYSTLVNLNGTGTFYRPIIFQFPQDTKAYDANFVETEFMIGDYLLGAPIVQPLKQERQVYFPGDKDQSWYTLEFDQDAVFNPGNSVRYFEGGSAAVIRNALPAPPPIFLRSGKLILTNKPKTRTIFLDSNFTLVAGLNNKRQASGEFIHVVDFNNQNQIAGCLSKGCNLILSLKPQGNDPNSRDFVLSWKNEGKSETSGVDKSKFLIQEMVIFDKDRILRLKNGKKIILDTTSGSSNITLE